ncbi:hypothetical protein [Agromyces humi]|uniref:hypothetical protein n=1 Tax=Agromyces humi TaxID=1766800 RepID=UPI001356857A|nr:hypothetical protein [Agromyces humi]
MTDSAPATSHAEFLEEADGTIISWYCTDCSEELGADPTRPQGEPSNCSSCGGRDLAWETRNVETDPSYPHPVISADPRKGFG